MKEYKVIGLMSGSSLDGLDICYTEFFEENGRWNYRNIIAETIPYSKEWADRLRSTEKSDAVEFCFINSLYGEYLGSLINSFLYSKSLYADLISSHGHTIFHQPHNKFTSQIGDGAAIYAITGIKTVSDFRVVDVALGGQGAPLVPIGERDLFEDYGMFLNLGGIANITIFGKENTIKAFDISPCNMALNSLCEIYFERSFDENGTISRSGNLNIELMEALERITYFNDPAPKSLGREFMKEVYLPEIEKFSINAEDKLFTVTSQITNEISKVINRNVILARKPSILATGGGVFNTFLMEMLQEKCDIEITVPEPAIIEFKEALIFAYLGVLRLKGMVNALASVTNARKDSIGGALWG